MNGQALFSDVECNHLVQAAGEYAKQHPIKWDLLLQMALCTGLRRGELFNTTWKDIDFERKTLDVSPKQDTEHTWEWHVKDTDRRTLPLTEELICQLASHQGQQPENHPYLFITPDRYSHIQQVRECGNWSPYKANYPINNFDKRFKKICHNAGVKNGKFHDLRRTCITNWFKHGLREFDVMKMAGHANFETTRTFYLAVSSDLVDRARAASSKAMEGISIAKPLQLPDKDGFSETENT